VEKPLVSLGSPLRRPLLTVLACGAMLAGGLQALSPPAAAATGDIYVADPAGQIVRVDPATGSQSVVALGGRLQNPFGLAFSPATLYASDPNSYFNRGVVFSVDPAGAQTVVSGSNRLNDIEQIAVEANGDILVADKEFDGGSGEIVRIDHTTGAQTALSSGGNLIDPVGIAVAPDGSIYVADFIALGGGDNARVIRIDPVTGGQTVVAIGDAADEISTPVGITVGPTGDLFVADLDTDGGAVIKVVPGTGAQTIVSSGDQFSNPGGVLFDANGSLLVSDRDAGPDGTGEIFRVDVGTGDQTTVTEGGILHSASQMALEPPASPKQIALKAKPKKVEKGKRTRLTATVTPCAGHEGDEVEFFRKSKLIGEVATDAACNARLKVKVRRTSRYTAVSPRKDWDHLAATSAVVKVKARRKR
jgi:DNA-binding beta-propeller fold protein YncE